MRYRFPDFDTLRLAITTGAVPDVVTRTAARVAFDREGSIRVQCEARLNAASRVALGRLGVQIDDPSDDELPEHVLCWPQLLPVQPAPQPEFSDRLPVLFELEQVEDLPLVVSEMLRLGNDRQAIRWIDNGSTPRALLRVVGPPYYTLLRAIDPAANGARLRAYVEQADRVWVELGQAHPLGRRLKLPAGKTLLLRAPRDWQLIEDGRFHDVYSLVEFALPDVPTAWQPVELEQKIRVPLRLAPSDSTEPAELWVLRGPAVAQMDAFVQSADESLLARLSFAVATAQGRTVVVLRARPGKSGPPVLVLDATAYRPVLKLPNLFIPCTARLHPPLRRDVVKQLLADDPLAIVWLEPREDTAFQPCSLPDTAFRPLSDWVEYALDQARQPLAEWMASFQFDFEPFLCRDETADPKRPRDPQAPKEFPTGEDIAPEPPVPEPKAAGRTKKVERKPASAPVPEFRAKPNELRQKLQALEQEFRKLATPTEAGPEHRDLWVRMTQINAALERTHDAAVCAGNALWLEGNAPPAAFWAWAPEMARVVSGEAAGLGDWLDRILTEPSPSVADINRLVALLVWSDATNREVPDLRERLAAVQQFLERHESHVGVRLLWLAWRATFRQSQNDVLLLARARDRVLERLFHNGLSPDLDLPTFLRFSGTALNDRLRAVREHVLHLRTVVGEWFARTNTSIDRHEDANTPAYIDLLFAWALARLGETTESRLLQARADASLLKKERDVVHTWLGLAFIYRIDQALEGKAGGQLPEDLLSRLPGMDKLVRYKIDRLRQRSRILEQVPFNPYREWGKIPERMRELATLCDELDRNRLLQRIEARLSETGLSLHEEAAVVVAVLDVAPRLGEAFAGTLLERVLVLLGRSPAPLDQVALLEKALFVAAHFDHPEVVQECVNRLRAFLALDHGKEVEKSIANLAQRSFFGLRKLGMRDEIAHMLEELAARVRRRSKTADEPPSSGDQHRIVSISVLLQVASGWLYFGQADQARPVFDEARDLLFEKTLMPATQTDLACAYLSALGAAPVEVAIGRMVELFQQVENISDNFMTSSHYSQSKLSVVETALLALLSEDVALDKTGRRWLDDDEYLVRKRIHADVRTAVTTGA